MSKISPLVSIIMNCYNGEKYLNEALKSIIEQTYSNWELIFWDNQSKDNSAEIVNSFKDSRIRYFFSEQFTDLGGARAKACKNANGDYLAILDCDDIWYPEKLKKQINYFSNPEIAICISNTLFFNSKKELPLYKKRPPEGHVTSQLIENYYISLESVLIKMEYVKKLNLFFNNEYSHIADFDLIVRLSTQGKLVYCPEILSGWRIHNNNASFVEKEKFFKEKFKWIKHAKLNNILKQYNISINNLEILTKAESQNTITNENKLNLKDLFLYSGSFKSRLKVCSSYLPFFSNILIKIKEIIFHMQWSEN